MKLIETANHTETNVIWQIESTETKKIEKLLMKIMIETKVFPVLFATFEKQFN